MADWVGATGATPGPVTTEVAAERDPAWPGASAPPGPTCVLYRVAEGRHGWPGSGDTSVWGPTTDAIGAAALLWEFFAAHPMP